jgi:sporulation protein YlmC with PRC-barrel domain
MHTKTISYALALITLPTLTLGLPQSSEAPQKQRALQDQSSESATPHFASASKLIGTDVWSEIHSDGSRTDLGNIRDYVVEAKSGTLTHVIVSSGGIGTIGDTLRKIPYSALSFDFADPKVTKVIMDMKSEEFKALPTIEKSELSPFACKGIAEARIAERKGARNAKTPKDKEAVEAGYNPDLSPMLASELDDMDVRASHGSMNAEGIVIDGSSVGSIHEAWIDCAAGKVAYLTFEHNKRQLVIPMSSMVAYVDHDTKSMYFATPCSMLNLATAPAIDVEENLTLANADFRKAVHEFYAELAKAGVGNPSKSSSARR